jgi:putative sigma-54 modulation protein
MRVNITGHHVDITESIRNYIESKCEKMERHFDNVTDINIILEVEKNRNKADADVHLRGVDLHATAENEDMYAAIDALTDKLDRQILKHKEKIQDHHRGHRDNWEQDEV